MRLGQNCSNCIFWRMGDDPKWGMCMAHPPQVAQSPMIVPSLARTTQNEIRWADNTVFPTTGAIAWCGEWSPVETQVN